jgi:hypothetical protein
MTSATRPPRRDPIRTDRVRRIGGQSFAFLPHRFLRDGFLPSLTPDELRLYVFLVLAADRNGVSFYSAQRIRCALEMSIDDYIEARHGLLRKDLVAADGARVQVLSLPPQPVTITASRLRREEQSAACRAVLASLTHDAGK